MSTVSSKNLLLSQPKTGQVSDVPSTPLTFVTSHINDEVIIEVEIPGVDPSTVDVFCDNHILSISCSRGETSITLPPLTDVSKIKADILWGMLTLRVPTPEVPPAQSIKVSIHDAVKKAPVKAPKEEFTVAE